MRLIREQWLPSAAEVTWQALHDIAILKHCTPGCESLAQVAASEFDMIIAAGLGPIKARFRTRLRLHDTAPTTHYTLLFDARGPGGSHTRGEADVRVETSGRGSRVSYTALITFESWTATLVEPLLEIAAEQMAVDFFAALNRSLAEKI